MSIDYSVKLFNLTSVVYTLPFFLPLYKFKIFKLVHETSIHIYIAHNLGIS